MYSSDAVPKFTEKNTFEVSSVLRLINRHVYISPEPCVPLRPSSTWWVRGAWPSGVWALWRPTCTTWLRSTRGPTTCQCWSSLWAASSERCRAKKKNNPKNTAAAQFNHRPVSAEIMAGGDETITQGAFLCRRGGFWRWRPSGSWWVSSGTCTASITSGEDTVLQNRLYRIVIGAPLGSGWFWKLAPLWHRRGSSRAWMSSWNDGLTAVLLSLSPTCHQAAAVTVPPVYRHLHLVLCISPSKGRPWELHKVWHGQNHPDPEGT